MQFSVGDIIETCRYHPVLVLYVDEAEDDIGGISLLDGSEPNSCSLIHCGLVKLAPDDVAKILRNRELYLACEKKWTESQGKDATAYGLVHEIRMTFVCYEKAEV